MLNGENRGQNVVVGGLVAPTTYYSADYVLMTRIIPVATLKPLLTTSAGTVTQFLASDYIVDVMLVNDVAATTGGSTISVGTNATFNGSGATDTSVFSAVAADGTAKFRVAKGDGSTAILGGKANAADGGAITIKASTSLVADATWSGHLVIVYARYNPLT